MKVTASALSLNVPDALASAAFLVRHFGFAESMAYEDKMVSLTHEDTGFNLVYLKTGLETFKPQDRAGSAGEGLLVVFVVEGVDAEYERLVAEGVPIVTSIETEPWGERYFQVEDPNGIIIQLVEWLEPPHGEDAGEGTV